MYPHVKDLIEYIRHRTWYILLDLGWSSRSFLQLKAPCHLAKIQYSILPWLFTFPFLQQLQRHTLGISFLLSFLISLKTNFIMVTKYNTVHSFIRHRSYLQQSYLLQWEREHIPQEWSWKKNQKTWLANLKKNKK